MTMEVTKVKVLNDLTTVLWTKPNGRHTEKGSLEECPDTPHKDFLDQLATVEADLAAKVGFGKKFEGRFTLTGISLTRNSAGRRQFSPSAKVDFGWGETGVSLPLLLEPDSEKPDTADNVLSQHELENVEQLFAEGLKYAEGERHQATLKLEDQKPADPFEGEGAEQEGELAGVH
jgi:hypothetical protein